MFSSKWMCASFLFNSIMILLCVFWVCKCVFLFGCWCVLQTAKWARITHSSSGNILCTRSTYKQIIFKSCQRWCDQIRRKKQREADNNNQNANNNPIQFTCRKWAETSVVLFFFIYYSNDNETNEEKFIHKIYLKYIQPKWPIAIIAYNFLYAIRYTSVHMAFALEHIHCCCFKSISPICWAQPHFPLQML